MHENTLEQGRFLHRTIKQVQTRLLSQHGPFTIETDVYSVELTFTQLCTLMTIRDHQDLNLKEIAEITQVSPPSASAMVDKLVELGAITREPGKKDRREVRVSISDRGLKAVESLEQGMLTSLTEILEGIGPDNAKLWVSVYEKIAQFLAEAETSDAILSGEISS